VLLQRKLLMDTNTQWYGCLQCLEFQCVMVESALYGESKIILFKVDAKSLTVQILSELHRVFII
jgi:hypothetical protein